MQTKMFAGEKYVLLKHFDSPFICESNVNLVCVCAVMSVSSSVLVVCVLTI